MKKDFMIKLKQIAKGGFILFRIFSIITAFYLTPIILPPFFWIYKFLFCGTFIAAVCTLVIKAILRFRKKSWPKLNNMENIWFNILFIFSLVLNLLTYPQSLQTFQKIFLS